MERREPKQWAEILKILKEAREDLEKTIGEERPIAEGITYKRKQNGPGDSPEAFCCG